MAYRHKWTLYPYVVFQTAADTLGGEDDGAVVYLHRGTLRFQTKSLLWFVLYFL